MLAISIPRNFIVYLRSNEFGRTLSRTIFIRPRKSQIESDGVLLLAGLIELYLFLNRLTGAILCSDHNLW